MRGREKPYFLTRRCFNIFGPMCQVTLQGSKKVRINSFKNTGIPNSGLCETGQKFCVQKGLQTSEVTDQIILVPQKKDIIE